MTTTAARSRYVLFPLAYLLWFVNCGLAIGIGVLGRQLLLRLVTVFHWSVWTMGVVDKFGLLLLGILWLFWAMVSEDRFRKGAEGGSSSLAATTLRMMLAVLVPMALMGIALLVLRRM